MNNIYIIGGSPCSGKSTVANILKEKYKLFYFKVDDYLEEYTTRGAVEDLLVCRRRIGRTSEDIWMRSPKIQYEEEKEFYAEIYRFIVHDLEKLQQKYKVITEGAAFLPSLVKNINLSNVHYLSLIPTPPFQVENYKKRTWVNDVLEGCYDKEQAFDNWMKRDMLFAKHVLEECEIGKEYCIINDGDITIEDIVRKVEIHFLLNDTDNVKK